MPQPAAAHLAWIELFEASPDFVTIAPIAGPPVFLNRAFREAMGIGPDETVASLIEFRPPGFLEYLNEVIMRAVREHGSWSGESDYISHNGDLIRVSQVTVLQVDDVSEVPLLATVSRNISQRQAADRALRESDARTRFALDAARAGVWEADLVTGTVIWSDTMRVVQGFTGEQFGGTLESFLALVHPGDRLRVDATMAAIRLKPRDFEMQFRALWADGTVHWIESHGRVVGDAAGRPIKILAVAQDVSDRKTLEAQLHQSQKLEAIGQLAGGLAHDFNNLLTAILGYGGLVESSLDPGDPRRADVEEIQKAGVRASHLTRQLLAFSRKQILKPEVLALNTLVADMSPMLKSLLGEHVEFVPHLAPHLANVRTDPGQMEQILVNLVVNARDAMRAGGRLSISTANLSMSEECARPLDIPSGDYVSLSIADTGIGMDDETKRRIFEPFFTTKEPGKGTGLGLATVFGIVKQSEGAIVARSEKGHGATFTVYLPAVPDHVIARHGRLDAPPRGTERILLVEDEDSVRALARVILERHGYAVRAVDSPKVAIASIGPEDRFELIISDVVMPGMSGPTMVEQLADICPGVPVLFMSGFAADAVGPDGMLGADTPFLQKPFTAPELLLKVRQTLDTRREGAQAGRRERDAALGVLVS